MSKLLRVEVSKKQWCRGKPDESMLRLANGKQCCIGFLARRLGAKVKDIEKVSVLEFMGNRIPSCYHFNYNFFSQLADAYKANDSKSISDTERIRQLKVIGKQMGVQFVFKP